MVRENAIRKSIEAGDPVLGARVLSTSPAVVDTYGSLDLDYVWIDTEHSGYSPYDSVVFNQFARAARSAGLEPFVRLSDSDPAMVRNMLDAGIGTILLPRIKRPEQLRAAVRAAKYSYDDASGERGIGASYPNEWGDKIDGYTSAADNSVLIGALIETEAAVENIEELLKVPELGFVFLGPVDLSISMGYPMETEHPEVSSAVSKVRAACAKSDVFVGEMASSAQEASRALSEGADIVRVGDDLRLIRESLNQRLTDLEALRE